jgi:hypothetical protein
LPEDDVVVVIEDEKDVVDVEEEKVDVDELVVVEIEVEPEATVVVHEKQEVELCCVVASLELKVIVSTVTGFVWDVSIVVVSLVGGWA